MNRRGRIAAAVGAGAVLIAASFALVAAGDDGDGDDVRAGATSTTAPSTTTTAPEETTTTVDLLPETTTTSVTRPPSTTTTTAAPLPVVGASGAVLQGGASAVGRKMDGEDCDTLGDDGWTVVGCGFATVKGGGTLVWLIETGLTKGTRAYVFGPASQGAPGSWRVLLEARDDQSTRWKSATSGGVSARVVDLSGDKADEIVFGFRAASGDGLAMDVVEGPSTVTAHRDLAGGRSRVSTGQWDTWALLSSGKYQHDTIRWQDNAWRIVLRTEEPATSVPPSQF